MAETPETLYRWALQEGGNILHVVECVKKWEADKALIVALEKLAEFAQHLPGCMEPGLVDEDCACGYWEAKQAARGGEHG